ncbi:unnamed protein product [Symbiodinium necroappetens]|uniref:Uncharacterized protein n=1 Tax=Symbiodinium necroappetens TaxID=1628268 RepID=A0A812Y8C5_9DINO|nr:unnamed protein product [Symbiodinium necroappetens]
MCDACAVDVSRHCATETQRRTPSRDGEPSNAYVWNMLIDREKDRNFSEADRIRDDLRDRGAQSADG